MNPATGKKTSDVMTAKISFSPGKQEKLEEQNTLKSKVSLIATELAMKEAL